MPSVFANIPNIPQPSWDLVADVQLLLQYHFMQNAFLAGTLVALVAGIIGYFMVVRGQSFAGHSLANVGFAGATGATLIGAPPVAGLFVAGILAALGIHALGVSTRQMRRSDIAIGATLTASLALGYLFVHLSTSANASTIYDVLFGDVVGIADGDVLTTAIAAVLLLAVMALIARPLLFASLDPDVAAARGVPVRALDISYLVLLAVVVALAVQVVGVLLIFALLVTPAAIAQQLTTRPLVSVALAVALALAFTWLGLAVAYFTVYPTGFFITTFAFATYVLTRGTRWLTQHLATSNALRLASATGEPL